MPGLSFTPPAPPPEHRLAVGTDLAATVFAHLQRSDLFRAYRQAFEATTGLPLVLREAGSFRTPLQGSPRVNPFCTLMTQSNQTCAACLHLQQRLEVEASRGPKTLPCHAGLSESVVPVRVGDTIVGYLQTGQVFLHAPSRKYFDRFARTLPNRRAGAGAHDVRAAYFKTRVVAPRQYASTIRLLAIFADHLATVSHQLLLRTAAVEPAAATRGRQFIAGHHAEDISLADAARAAHLSTAYFCKLFKVATGVGFAEYLARTRIETANRMLLDPRLHISEAAFAAGFQSLSQFNRVFRRVMGEAPGQYRERMHRQGGRAARPGALGHAA